MTYWRRQIGVLVNQCECRWWMSGKCGCLWTSASWRCQMFMWLGTVPGEIVLVLVMLVMGVPMAMLYRLMHVLVLVMLREVQPDPSPISAAAIQNASEVDSPSRTSDTAAPMKGAVEK